MKTAIYVKKMVATTLFASFSLITYTAQAEIRDSGGYPSIPHAGEVSRVNDLIRDARVDVVETQFNDGFHVVDSSGNEFFVDNIDNPRCAVYTNVVQVEQGAFVNPNLQIQQVVEVPEINFSNCF